MIPLPLLRQSAAGGSGELFITSNQSALNLKTLWEASNPPAVSGDTVTFTCDPSLIFSSNVQSTGYPLSNAPPSIDTDVWAAGVNLVLNIPSAEVTGAGGKGTGPNEGGTGGTALLARHPITVDASGTTMNGGGGGGAGTDQWNGSPTPDSYQAGGGGGAGRPAGTGTTPTTADNNAAGAPGSFTTGGAGGNFGSDPNQPTVCSVSLSAGSGGDLGTDGGDASDTCQSGSEDNIGGNAGFSVDGLSNVTWVTAPTLVGPTNP